jgi:mannose-6-phosphate isomerase-like protein (cupin superfamily)
MTEKIGKQQNGPLRQTERYRDPPAAGRRRRQLRAAAARRLRRQRRDHRGLECRHGPHRAGAGAGPNPTHYHANNDVCWYILSGKIRLIAAKSDGSDRNEIILAAGDFVYIPSGAIHVIANASQTEEASLVFCYVGVPNVEASGNVWLTAMHDQFVAPRS